MITYFDNIPSLVFIQVLYLKFKKKKILTFFFDVNQSAEDWLNSQVLSFSDILSERRKIPSQAKKWNLLMLWHKYII